MQERPADAGDMVIGWLTRVAAVLLVIGLIGFEALSIVVTKFQLGDIAASAGSTAISTYAGSHNVATAYQQAESVAADSGATIAEKSFRVNADGSVEFTIRKTASTLLLQHLKATESWTHVKEHAVVEPNSFNTQ
jgi:hypothetical protein